MKNKKILVWFRNDLRLHDNEMLVEAIAKSDSILPVYFFDPRYFENTRFGTAKTGIVRASFLLESILSLRKAFQRFGGDILLVQGKPEDMIRDLVEQFDIAEVYHHREVGPEETEISGHVEDLLWTLKINLKHFIGHTLYNKEDLPFPIKDIPDVFAQFKKKTERDAIVKACFLTPEHIDFVENADWGQLPSLKDLGFETVAGAMIEKYATGGEDSGLQHLAQLLEAGADIYLKQNTKHTPEKPGFSSRLSAWLTIGCLSPRMVYWKVKEAEGVFGLNANFSQIFLGLLWRDYFRFMFKKHGIAFLQETDLEKDIMQAIERVDPALEKWKTGCTAHPVVDKYMYDLNATGFIPHSGRLLVATYLVHVLKIHWTCGAAYFEEKLIDYAPASNWGNWASVAGIGKDARSKNTFDLNKQIKILDIAVADSPSFA
ncbi:DASH family cryptochrome [Pedobacter heparinus]|uniref:Cryptochrome DASH n=1 Tax=Pedobacter heparinus (strain ATCC 13125 / DSM 2366 / CIP 104194 / JCM 7457 / NBRC 12017 / NCIMB 9290 / NRRL B-14731 / HIM 762-3) TaxID=485917 RepID=C6XUB6_PEDHD|nr:DASH family cryptochrome [Pedobacter heparinus]ACU05909.1 cryptochrome, DASH family [Pedobacter heparinus DSM 2366]